MPFTPFHMGAGLIAKAGLDRHFSVISFGLAQVAMDIEPGIGMINGAAVLHGWSHTVGGALAIAALVTLVAPWIVRPMVTRWNSEAAHYRVAWLKVVACRWPAVATGAFFGTLSHVTLDALIHADMNPFAPVAMGNPLLGGVEHDAVYGACAAAALVGFLLWLLRKWRGQGPSTR